MDGVLKRVVAFSQAMESWTAKACLTVALAAVLADLVGRELLGRSIFGSQRIAVLANAMIGLIGFSFVVGKGGHMRPAFFDKLGPAAWQRPMNRLADLVSSAVCATLGGFSVQFVLQTQKFGETLLSLPVPLWPVQLVLPWMFFASGLKYLIFAVQPALRPVEDEGAMS